MFLKALLVLLPALAHGIKINIDASTDEAHAKVHVSGSDVSIISDKDRSIFNINDYQLKHAAYVFSGKFPTDAYVRSPTPWGDLYKSYNWEQVKRTMTPVTAKVLGITSTPEIVSEKDFINNSSVKAIYNAGITQDLQNTVSHSWSKGGNFEVGTSVEVDISFFSASASMSYSESWGQDYSKTQTVTLGSSSGVQVELNPGQAVTASLRADRGTMEIEVEYSTEIKGQATFNYEGGFRGHNFWAYPIQTLLNTVNSPQVIKSKEIIKIGFYANGNIVVKDKVSNTRLLEKPILVQPVSIQ